MNANYFVYGKVLKIEPETIGSYVTIKIINTSEKAIKCLKNIGIAVQYTSLEIGQKVLIVFESKTNDVLIYFPIE